MLISSPKRSRRISTHSKLPPLPICIIAPNIAPALSGEGEVTAKFWEGACPASPNSFVASVASPSHGTVVMFQRFNAYLAAGSFLATQSRVWAWPSRSVSDLPLMVSPLTLPVYFAVNLFPLNSRVT